MNAKTKIILKFMEHVYKIHKYLRTYSILENNLTIYVSLSRSWNVLLKLFTKSHKRWYNS